jgi:Proton-conducting membrane transporter
MIKLIAMVLPVLFILIVVFGHGENRFRSAFLLFLYTLAGSLPMLLSILTIYSYLDSTDYQLISFNEISLESQKWLWVSVPFSKENLPNRDLNKNSSTITASIHTVAKQFLPFLQCCAKPEHEEETGSSAAAGNLNTGKFIKLNRKKMITWK